MSLYNKLADKLEYGYLKFCENFVANDFIDTAMSGFGGIFSVISYHQFKSGNPVAGSVSAVASGISFAYSYLSYKKNQEKKKHSLEEELEEQICEEYSSNKNE